MIRTLIVDDERAARERLQLLLSPIEDIEVVGEAEDGIEAIERIGELQPDLVQAHFLVGLVGLRRRRRTGA